MLLTAVQRRAAQSQAFKMASRTPAMPVEIGTWCAASSAISSIASTNPCWGCQVRNTPVAAPQSPAKGQRQRRPSGGWPQAGGDITNIEVHMPMHMPDAGLLGWPIVCCPCMGRF